MAIVRAKELRMLDDESLRKRYEDIRKEYMIELTQARSGGRAPNPGKVRTLRRAIAVLKTIMRERELGINLDVTASKVKRKRKTSKPKEKTEKTEDVKKADDKKTSEVKNKNA